MSLMILLLCTGNVYGQELFILTEPASTMPKGVLSVRSMGEFYTQAKALRTMIAGRISYGITSKLTFTSSLVVSDHHSPLLSDEFPTNHAHNIRLGYPYKFNGIHLLAKYRFLSIDRKNEHFRMALIAEGSQMYTAHDEAEPDLFDDNSGWGVGLISTYLLQKFAVSVNGGVIKPRTYVGKIPDPFPNMPYVPVKIQYPYAYNFDLCLGYMVLPRRYKSYKQANLNVYLEFKGKSFSPVDIYLGGPVMSVTKDIEYYKYLRQDNALLLGNTYVDLNYGVQLILSSNLRIDASLGTPIISRTIIRDYPVLHIGLQRFLY